MYGSCQDSSGIAPRYAPAASFTISSTTARSSSRIGRIAMSATVRLVLEPRAGHGGPELRLWAEAERGVELLRVVGLQPDVLARHLLSEPLHHRRGDPLPAVRRRRPDVEQVRVGH